MAITHANFLTQVRNYTEVSSTVLSDSQIQEFIRNVELDVAGKVDYDDFNIIVAPTPATADTVQINYIKDAPNFTSTNNTFLSTYQESMLLHGVLAECFRFLKGPQDMYKLYNDKYNEEIQNFALQQMGRRRRAEYDDGVPRIKVPSPSPNTTY